MPGHLVFMVLALALLAMNAHAAGPAETTAAAIWAEYQKSPNTHPNVPNVSFAGYGFGETPVPTPKIVANVRDSGAKGDGQTDDTPAFKAAVEKAKKAGGGAILVPIGEYKLSDVIVLDADNLVLRGEGDKSILAFTRPVSQVAHGVEGSWFGGLVWIGRDGAQPDDDPAGIENGVPIVKPAKQGDLVVEVSPQEAKKLAPLIGKTLPMVWTGSTSGRDLAKTIAGHPSMEAFNWNSWSAYHHGAFVWTWANQIMHIEGTQVTLKKPLRLDVDPAWKVELGTDPNYFISNCGIEKVFIKFPLTKKAPHLREPGWNGPFLKRAAQCWVRDVTVENADNGMNFTEAVNCTAHGLRVIGRDNHHGTMMRSMSHDNLIEAFKIESKPHHGINTEGTSSGNVWRDGVMNGTFDSHCMMSFDSVRTNITVTNIGGPGGASDAGPFVGRRMVHWNIRVTNGKGEWIAQPAILPSGAIVGIQGTPVFLKDTGLWHLPNGLNKGCLIADMGQTPSPPDLYEAQLKLRLGTRK